MSSAQPQPVDRKVVFLGGAFFVCLTVATGIFAVWSLSDIHRQYAAWLDGNVAVLVEDTGAAIFYGSPPLLVALFMFGVYGIWIGMTGRRSEAFDRRALKPLSGLIVIGLISLFVGRYIGNVQWAESFEARGYTVCQDKFVLTGKWAIRVWANTPMICLDDDFKNKLRNPEYNLFDINRYYKANDATNSQSSH